MKASPDDQALLLDLLAFDTKLAQLDYKAKSLPQHAELTKIGVDVLALRQVAAEQAGAREDIEIELKRLESDVAVVEARIARDTARAQLSSSSPKDIQALEAELTNLRKRQYDLEEIELTVMERLETVDAALALANGELDDILGRVALIEELRDGELGTIANERTHTAANRRTIEAKIPADLLALYEKQKARYGAGASHLKFGSSAGVKLLENDLQAIRATAPDEVIMCPISDAILVRTKDSGL